MNTVFKKVSLGEKRQDEHVQYISALCAAFRTMLISPMHTVFMYAGATLYAQGLLLQYSAHSSCMQAVCTCMQRSDMPATRLQCREAAPRRTYGPRPLLWDVFCTHRQY